MCMCWADALCSGLPDDNAPNRFTYIPTNSCCAVTTLGVTGGIGSGKTTVCRLLEEHGARVFYADEVAKTIMHENKDARAQIRETFGSTSYNDAGELNRSYLAAQVFTDPDKLELLNAIVHPLVFEAFDKAKSKAQSENVSLLVHEAALLFEAGADEHVDHAVVVTAPDALRIQRVVERDDTTERAVRDRMQHQLPQEELIERADLVIKNDGSIETLESAVADLYERFAGPDA